jgi:hypothetical protein
MHPQHISPDRQTCSPTPQLQWRQPRIRSLIPCLFLVIYSGSIPLCQPRICSLISGRLFLVIDPGQPRRWVRMWTWREEWISRRQVSNGAEATANMGEPSEREALLTVLLNMLARECFVVISLGGVKELLLLFYQLKAGCIYSA